MDIEKEIEDLCLERLRLVREDTTQAPADNIEQQAKAQARYEIKQGRIQGIDKRLFSLRSNIANAFAAQHQHAWNQKIKDKVAKNIKARNEGALQKEYKVKIPD